MSSNGEVLHGPTVKNLNKF
ncbi:hypothetical protein [Nostoc commune]